MLMVISPAKALNFEPPPVAAPLTQPALKSDLAVLAALARKLSVRQLKGLMGISDQLAALNRERFQAFDPDAEDGLQAAYAFNGDVYLGLRARELTPEALAWANDRLRILSGLYGLLRPTDAIQPYRLEMGSAVRTARGKSLYAFWGPRIARALNEAAVGHANPTLVNLASQEYFGAVSRKALKIPLITCHLREEKDGMMRTLSFYAKRARGMMARYAIDHRIDKAADLKGFDSEGYRFQPQASSETEWVFSRPQPPPISVQRALARAQA